MPSPRLFPNIEWNSLRNRSQGEEHLPVRYPFPYLRRKQCFSPPLSEHLKVRNVQNKGPSKSFIVFNEKQNEAASYCWGFLFSTGVEAFVRRAIYTHSSAGITGRRARGALRTAAACAPASPHGSQPEGHAAGTTDGGGGSRSTRCRPRAPTAPPLPGYPQAPHRLHLPSPAPASPPRPAARRPAPPGPARPPPHGPAPLAMSLAESCLTSSGIRSHWHSERHRSISVSSREPAFLVAMAGPMGPGGGRGRGGGSGREGGGGGGGERTAAAPGACAPGAAELEGCGPRRAPRQRRHLPAAAGTRAGPASQPPRGAAASGGGRGRRDALREDSGRAPWQPGERGPGTRAGKGESRRCHPSTY